MVPEAESVHPHSEGQRPRAALVLTGGGITAFSFEVGCLAAFDRVCGANFCSRFFDVFIGASAGSILASMVAAGISPDMIRAAILSSEKSSFNFQRADVYRLDLSGILSSGWTALRSLVGVLQSYRQNGSRISLVDFAHILQEQLPSGFFSLEPLQEYIARCLAEEGIEDRLDAIPRELLIPAVDLDRGARVVFGSPGWRDVKLSQAIAASCAIPAFFRPFQIGDRSYVDGGMGGRPHLDLAIERGVKTILLVNPIVPLAHDPERTFVPTLSTGRATSISDLGISYVNDQSQRIEGRERLELALQAMRSQHPDVEVVLIEPARDDTLLFLNGPMSFESRREIVERGYEITLRRLEREHVRFRQLFLDPVRASDHSA